ncbi:hypothetical protein M0D69_20465 [Caballeronia sp. SEWSISQ10-4 2]|uniref:hypothetical protein n=1 Tax=Caballeronia sp. SEWSISQ10-4 2 TaxID=2937438 RepID=UPI0026544BEE|nr:hypothetical protein [Caballeronia sp. SEWSISQ10-4 2]MDN7180331.1 hypothetical protein [Caballeronia sp. SEWSISQ10-4 2]
MTKLCSTLLNPVAAHFKLVFNQAGILLTSNKVSPSETICARPASSNLATRFTFQGEIPHGPERLIKTLIRFLSILLYPESSAD